MIICKRTRLCKSLLHQDVQYSYDIHDIIYNCITARGLYGGGCFRKNTPHPGYYQYYHPAILMHPVYNSTSFLDV